MIQNKETKERFVILGFISVMGSHVCIANKRTKEIFVITTFELTKKYELEK